MIELKNERIERIKKIGVYYFILFDLYFSGKEYKRKRIIDKTHHSYKSLENKNDISLILRVAEKLGF